MMIAKTHAGLKCALGPAPVVAATVLQPTFVAREACSLYAIRDAQFADGFAEVVADGAFGKVQLGCDECCGLTFTGKP